MVRYWGSKVEGTQDTEAMEDLGQGACCPRGRGLAQASGTRCCALLQRDRFQFSREETFLRRRRGGEHRMDVVACQDRG